MLLSKNEDVKKRLTPQKCRNELFDAARDVANVCHDAVSALKDLSKQIKKESNDGHS